MNDLNELNQVLFQTLKDVKADNIDATKAKSIVDVSNAIINNGKLQLSAYRLANQENLPEQFALPQSKSVKREVNVELSEEMKPNKAVEIRLAEKKKETVLEKRKDPVVYDDIAGFAKILGYDSLAQAQAEIGELSFQNKYNNWKANQ